MKIVPQLITQHAHDQWAEFFPGHSIADALASSRPCRPPFIQVDHFTYLHHPNLNCYFVLDGQHRVVTVRPQHRTALATTTVTPRTRPLFHSPAHERDWLIEERDRLRAANDPALRVVIESMSNEIKSLKSAARSYLRRKSS